jgi:hypothetical protein
MRFGICATVRMRPKSLRMRIRAVKDFAMWWVLVFSNFKYFKYGRVKRRRA